MAWPNDLLHYARCCGGGGQVGYCQSEEWLLWKVRERGRERGVPGDVEFIVRASSSDGIIVHISRGDAGLTMARVVRWMVDGS